MKSPPEQRLFGLIVVLAFLTGLTFGLTVLFLGTIIYNFIQSGFYALAPSSYDWPLSALPSIIEGAFFVLLSITINLCLQFLKVQSSRRVFAKHGLKIIGFFLMGLGVDILLNKPLYLALTVLKSPSFVVLVSEFALTFLCALVVPASLIWYLLVRDKRRVAQRG